MKGLGALQRHQLPPPLQKSWIRHSRCSRRVPAVAACTDDVAALLPVQSLLRVAIRFPGLGKQIDTTFWFLVTNILTAIVHFGVEIALSRALPIVFRSLIVADFFFSCWVPQLLWYSRRLLVADRTSPLSVRYHSGCGMSISIVDCVCRERGLLFSVACDRLLVDRFHSCTRTVG